MVEGAEPLDKEEWNDDNNDAMDASTEASANVATIKRDENKELDCYAAYMDPKTLTDLLMWSQLEMDEYTVFFLLMTFLFYEHEWDLVGFVLDTVFAESLEEGDDNDDEDYGYYDENGSKKTKQARMHIYCCA